MPAADPRRHAPATLRNREPILAVLKDVLPSRGLLLEIASGSGEHAAFMAPRLPPTLIWQPTDADPAALAGIDAHAADTRAANLRPVLHLDVTSVTWRSPGPMPSSPPTSSTSPPGRWPRGSSLVPGAC